MKLKLIISISFYSWIACIVLFGVTAWWLEKSESDLSAIFMLASFLVGVFSFLVMSGAILFKNYPRIFIAVIGILIALTLVIILAFWLESFDKKQKKKAKKEKKEITINMTDKIEQDIPPINNAPVVNNPVIQSKPIITDELKDKKSKKKTDKPRKKIEQQKKDYTYQKPDLGQEKINNETELLSLNLPPLPPIPDLDTPPKPKKIELEKDQSSCPYNSLDQCISSELDKAISKIGQAASGSAGNQTKLAVSKYFSKICE